MSFLAFLESLCHSMYRMLTFTRNILSFSNIEFVYGKIVTNYWVKSPSDKFLYLSCAASQWWSCVHSLHQQIALGSCDRAVLH